MITFKQCLFYRVAWTLLFFAPLTSFAHTSDTAHTTSSPLVTFGIYALSLIAAAATAIAICLYKQRKRTLANDEISKHARNETKNIAQALEDSEGRFRTLIETINDVVWEIDSNNRYTYISPQVETLLGYTPDELATLNFPNFSRHPSMAVHINDAAMFGSIINQRETFTALESWQFSKEGNPIVFEISGVPVFDKDQSFKGYRGVARHITARKHAQEELRFEKERFLVTLESIDDGVVRLNTSGIIEYINPAACQLINVKANEITGGHVDTLINELDEANGQHIRDMIKHALIENRSIHFVSTTLLKDNLSNNNLNIEIRITPIKNNKGGSIGTIIVFHDITEIKRLTGQMAYQATHDTLTELYNRSEFERRLGDVIESAKKGETTHVLCYLDLDQFNVINDTYGHIAGDELLKELGQALLSTIRESDILARIGGDEFGILLIDCDTSRAKEIAQKLCKSIRDVRYEWQNQTIQVGVSAGLVLLDESIGTLSDVFSAADSACFVAKDLGRNRIHLFSPNDTELTKRYGMMQALQNIRDAIKNDHFVLYCESFVPLSEGAHKIKHYETLIRMIDDSGKEISPIKFIPAAERYHLMPEIDRWVIKNTLKTISSAQPQNPNTIYTINLSGQSLSDQRFLSFITEQFKQCNVSPKHICFEITETAAISHLSSALRLITSLRNMGCSFALDDFGTGLSSFNYLRTLPVQYLKIDGSFVRNIQSDSIDYALVNTITQIGRLMGLHTIAEYVENAMILDKVKEIGVDYAQGHGVAKTNPLIDVVLENKMDKTN